MKLLPLLLIDLLLLFSLGFAGYPGGKKITSTKIISKVVRMDINNVDLPLRNDGEIGEDGQSWYPRGQTLASFLYTGGFALTGYVNGELRASWMASSSLIEEWQAGKWGMDPTDPLARFYVVTREDGPGSPAFVDWADAVSLGADFVDEDGNGVYDPYIDRPTLLGEKTIWTVFNDGTSMAQRTPRLGTQPMGLEILQTAWADNLGEELIDVIFFWFQIINISNTNIQDLIFSVWDDPDIGDAYDDLIACDTLLNIGYCYNNGDDAIYGTMPPAFGVKLLQGCLIDSPGDTAYVFRGASAGVDTIFGKKNLPWSSFMTYIQSSAILGDPSNAIIARYYQEGGLDEKGNPIDPTQWGVGGTVNTNPKYFYSGDPVEGTGWIDNDPNDKRFLVNNGPFNLAPADTQDIIFAYVIGQGSDALNSIIKMKENSEFVEDFFPNGHILNIVTDDSLISVDSIFTFSPILYNLADNDSIINSSWELLEYPTGSQAQIIGGPNNTATLDPDLPGSYLISCLATINNGAFLKDSLLVRAITNHPPQASLSIVPQTLSFGQSALADASASFDPDGDPLSYFWEFPDWTLALFSDSSQFVNFTPLHSGVGNVTVTISDSNFTDQSQESYLVNPMDNGLHFLDSIPVDTMPVFDPDNYVTDIFSLNGKFFISTNSQYLYVLDGFNNYQCIAASSIGDIRFVTDGNILITHGPWSDIDIYEFENNYLLSYRSTINESEEGDILLNFPYLYIMKAAGPGSLLVYDLSDLNNPLNISNFSIGILNVDISFSEGIASYFSRIYGVITLDISNPYQITALDTLDIFNSDARQIEYKKNRIYVLNGKDQGNKITVIDAIQPDDLQQAGTITVESIIPGYSDNPIFGMKVYGDLLALSCIDGIKIFDVSDPYDPHERVNFHNGFKSTISAWEYPYIYANFFGEQSRIIYLYKLAYDSTWVGIKEIKSSETTPDQVHLFQNYPNPFNAGTTIRYQLQEKSMVKLVVYNLLGQQVRWLVREEQPAGEYIVWWDGVNAFGQSVSSGIYIYRIIVDNYVQSRKMMLLK